MGQVYPELDDRLRTFITSQPMFFVATAPCLDDAGDGGHVNVPEGIPLHLRHTGSADSRLPRSHRERRGDHRAPAAERPARPQPPRPPQARPRHARTAETSGRSSS